MLDAALGIVLAGAASGVAWLVWGRGAVFAALWFGLAAAAIHVAATALLRPALRGPFKQLLARWAMGMGLRLVGVVVFGVMIFTQRELFPALPSAVGFCGVLLPLLFSEMRLLR